MCIRVFIISTEMISDYLCPIPAKLGVNVESSAIVNKFVSDFRFPFEFRNYYAFFCLSPIFSSRTTCTPKRTLWHCTASVYVARVHC